MDLGHFPSEEMRTVTLEAGIRHAQLLFISAQIHGVVGGKEGVGEPGG